MVRYTQKDICRAFDIKRDTLRHYEKLGILEPEIDPSNGYHYYDDWQINLLWDTKRYQAMGFSLAQVRDILRRDSLDDVRRLVDGRVECLERELAYRIMALDSMRRYRKMLDQIDSLLGSYAFRELDSIRFVARREVHDLLLDEGRDGAGRFVNEHQAICLPPVAYFPEAHDERYFWGFAMQTERYERLGGPTEGSKELPTGTCLVTCVDAGERWGFGQHLFQGLLGEAMRRGLHPIGPLCGFLLARTHGATGAYHRYVMAYLPLKTPQNR